MVKQDWHPANIIANLRKQGTSLVAVSHSVRLASSTQAHYPARPLLKGEWLIATALNIHPVTIPHLHQATCNPWFFNYIPGRVPGTRFL
ncbi:transcriptional regulator [Buttiauxella warmboldiae]|uniref:Transcriptional regulator n=1 Tax=Buttiauxella warmboldiae TaxID=82993 RepID=A0A3N5DR82_9ENTR|nr:helix-turn-helix domain-containing protein [Buttiauxella warmboldiae]RPH24149.1 transcriptional regulator [Buttiauxella warmboldiae]